MTIIGFLNTPLASSLISLIPRFIANINLKTKKTKKMTNIRYKFKCVRYLFSNAPHFRKKTTHNRTLRVQFSLEYLMFFRILTAMKQAALFEFNKFKNIKLSYSLGTFLFATILINVFHISPTPINIALSLIFAVTSNIAVTTITNLLK